MANKVISFHYTMTTAEGEKIYSSLEKEPLAFIEGSGQIMPALEAVLHGMSAGEKKKITLTADQAFGEYDKEQVFQVSREQLPQQEINVGDQFQDDPEAPPLTVIEVADDHNVMDRNHPLAGVDLVFDVEVTGIREATPEEIAHGHVHGEGGAHH
jgi:FKBP-type peptidyl-prolyl cis-trans isomerase SlyD